MDYLKEGKKEKKGKHNTALFLITHTQYRESIVLVKNKQHK
jgi:hypothetical protein